MEEDVARAAVKKLRAMFFAVGHPKQWQDIPNNSMVHVSEDAWCESSINLKIWAMKKLLAKTGAPPPPPPPPPPLPPPPPSPPLVVATVGHCCTSCLNDRWPLNVAPAGLLTVGR